MALYDTDLYFGIRLQESVRSYLVHNKSEYTLKDICNGIVSIKPDKDNKRECQLYRLFTRRVYHVVKDYLSIEYLTKVRHEVTAKGTVMYIYQTNFSKIDEYTKSINS